MDLHTEQPQLEWLAATNGRMPLKPWSLRLRNLGAHFPSLGVIPLSPQKFDSIKASRPALRATAI